MKNKLISNCIKLKCLLLLMSVIPWFVFLLIIIWFGLLIYNVVPQ